MPSYAVLGATGQTGNSLLKVLMQSKDNNINAYCRNKSKLLGQFPEYANDSRLRIFDGSLKDTEVLANCCRGVGAVLMTVAAKENEPGCSVAIDTARQVIAAMEVLRDETGGQKLPTLVQLNSASTEPILSRTIPHFAHAMLYRAMYNVYKDLENAERFLRQYSDWLNIVYFKPAAISHDVQGGHVLSLEESASPVSFLDVAAGMIEAADEGEKYAGKAVSVLPKSGKAKIPWEAPLALLKGLVLYYFPWTWRWLGA